MFWMLQEINNRMKDRVWILLADVILTRKDNGLSGNSKKRDRNRRLRTCSRQTRQSIRIGVRERERVMTYAGCSSSLTIFP